jgi:hypothetical protein
MIGAALVADALADLISDGETAAATIGIVLGVMNSAAAPTIPS